MQHSKFHAMVGSENDLPKLGFNEIRHVTEKVLSIGYMYYMHTYNRANIYHIYTLNLTINKMHILKNMLQEHSFCGI